MSTQATSNNSELKPCPNRPNCVSSQGDNSHFVEPFKLLPKVTVDMNKLLSILSQLEERISVSHTGNHIHAEISSRIFGFVDDLDLIVDEENQVIHIRSASRLGYYDFGVNRKRVANLRELLIKSEITQWCP